MENPVLSGCQPGNDLDQAKVLLSSLSDGLFSHPQKPLSKHLTGVWQNCLTLLEELKLPVDRQELMTAALTHDLGKADNRFQAYLAGRGQGVNHAFPSAWLTLFFSRNCGEEYRRAIWAAEAVRRHHTHLVNFSDLSAAWAPDDFIWQDTAAAVQALLPNYPLALQEADFENFRDLFFDLEDYVDETTWLDLRLKYSMLVASDRLDAIGINDVHLPHFPDFLEPTFDHSEDPISQWRSQVQQECLLSALEKIQGPGAYSLTLPTGAGKTITGLKIADALIHRLNYKTLVYALPFISIVEQTTKIARNIYGASAIQEDHSLRPPSSENEDGSPWHKMIDLFRYWHSPVILTTMVQFWDAIFAPQANRTMNFHRLSRAIVILDEPQTIPTKYWACLGETLRFLSRELDTIFILMTATQPHILGKREKRSEIAPHIYQFPQVRHQYHAIEMDQQFGIEKVLDVIGENRLFEQNSGLVVMNTKKSALDMFDLIQKNLPYETTHLMFLSAWLTPWRRKNVLNALKIAEEGTLPRLLVSTQVIEAGVDLDFSWVFRDIGPLDSIIQVAGRCNRHFRQAQSGQVYTAQLKNERGRPFSGMVYDSVLLEATKEVLKENPSFDESHVAEITERYYQIVMSRLTPQDLFAGLKSGEWGETHILYEEQTEKNVLLIIEEDDHVREIVNQLETGNWSLENLDKKKGLMQELQQYIIEIPERMIGPLRLKTSQLVSDEEILRKVLHGSMYWLSRVAIGESDEHIYHPVKGFIPPVVSQDPWMF
jgi:CRISPR-associated endonuclease/helicase Cas3